MDLYDQYKRINAIKGADVREKNQNLVKQSFKETLKTAANSYLVQFYTAEDIAFNYFEEENVIIEGSTSSVKYTNKDEKKVICSMKSHLEVGSYITWRDREWLIVAEELSTTSAYKKFTLKPCVVKISKELGGIIYDYPVVFENLSIQSKSGSDVKVDNVAFDIDDSKEQLIVPNCDVIKSIIDINKRVMLNNEKVYLIKKINNFASEGVSIVSIEQVVETVKDNFDKNIADYEETFVKPPEIIEGREIIISGEKTIKIGSKRKYLVELFINNELDNVEELNFKIEEVNGETIDNLIENISIDNRTIEFSAIRNIKNINKILKITASSTIDERVLAEYEITIKGVV